MLEQENQKLIEQLKQENEKLQAKVELLCVLIGDYQEIQEKIASALGLETEEDEDGTDLIEIEFAKVEHARYLLALVGNALAGDAERRELYYQVLEQIETLERHAFDLRSELAREAPISVIVETLALSGIALNPVAYDRLLIERAELAREAV